MEMEEEAKTLKDYLQIARRRKYYIAIPLILLLAASILVALILPPVYRSEATILIEQQHIPADLVKSTVVSFADERIQQIQQKIMRIDNINKIIAKYNLYKKDRGQLSPSELAENFTENVVLELVSADVISQGRKSKATLAFSLSFDNKDAVLSQRVANELVTLFLAENARSRTEQAKDTTRFLEEEARKVKERIQITENQLAEYKDKYSGSLPEHLSTNMSSKARIETELQQLRLQEKMVRERKSSLRSQLAITSPQESIRGMEDAIPDSLPALRSEYNRLLDKYSESHPDVKSIKRKIKNFKSRKGKSSGGRGNISNPVYLQLTNELRMADIELKNMGDLRTQLNQSIQNIDLSISQTHQVERGYNDLLRDLEGNQKKYHELKAKHMDAKLALTLEEEQKSEKFSILEPPRVPTKPEKPNRIKIIFLGLVMSIFGGMGVAYLAEMMDESIRSQTELTSLVGSEPLVVIPYLVNDEDLAISRKNKINFSIIGIGILLCLILAVHFLYMHLDLIFYRVMHKIETMMLS